MLPDLPKPSIIAHRGASAYAPENTLAAFKLALQQGADGIELDVRLTSDGQVVVFHDRILDRVTPSKGLIKDFTLAELRKMDAGSHFDIAFRGESIPSLEEVFKSVGQLTYINVEIKDLGLFNNPLPEKVVKLVRRYRLSQRVFISSFNFFQFIGLHRRYPKIPIGLLSQRGKAHFLSRAWVKRVIKYNSFHIEISDATPEIFNTIHRRGDKIFVYPVNEEMEMQRLFKMGVDGIFTKDPLRARNILNQIRS